MKTTVDISDPLLKEARKLAAREKTTLRELVEEGLARVVADKRRGRPFRLRDASVKGEGLQAEFLDAGWEKIRDAIYEGRGS